MTIVYCGVCGFPPEYCEFGGVAKRCKEWLEKSHKDLYEKLYSSDPVESLAISSLSLEKQDEIERKIQKQQAKEEAKAERELQKIKESKITIRMFDRSKRKHATAISGVEVFDIDLKKLAKTFATKFATGASVTKTAEGKDEIVIQGAVAEAAETLIKDMLQQQGLADIKVEIIEEKPSKKKKQPA